MHYILSESSTACYQLCVNGRRQQNRRYQIEIVKANSKMEFVIDDQNDTKILKPLRQWKTKPAQIQYHIMFLKKKYRYTHYNSRCNCSCRS